MFLLSAREAVPTPRSLGFVNPFLMTSRKKCTFEERLRLSSLGDQSAITENVSLKENEPFVHKKPDDRQQHDYTNHWGVLA